MKYESQGDFLKACEGAPLFTGDWYIDDRDDDAFEDDGCLHIIRKGIRACFDVGDCQLLKPREQNENAQEVLDYLKLDDFDHKRVFIEEPEEEDDEEDEICPHCGQCM